MDGNDSVEAFIEATRTLTMPTAWLNLLQTPEIGKFNHHIIKKNLSDF